MPTPEHTMALGRDDGRNGPRTPASRTRTRTFGRILLLVSAGVALLAGLDAALVRLGALSPVPSTELGSLHGPLMIYGFLGTAICLERAVALNNDTQNPRRWAYLAPAAAALAGLLALLLALAPEGASSSLPILASLGTQESPALVTRLLPGALWSASMAVLVTIYVEVHRHRQASYAVLIQLTGAIVGLGGALLWARGIDTATIIPWFLGFPILTIIGERLELARLSFGTASTEARILTETLLVLLALVSTLLVPTLGYPFLGLALAVLVADTAWHDVARRTIRLPGLPRFAAAAMLSGYAWIAVPTILWVLAPPAFSGYAYDAIVHAITLGFVVSMLLAHAPVIIPAVVGRELPYHPVMWAPLVLLHTSLALRLFAGARGAEEAWRLGGTIGVSAVLVFIMTILALALTASRAQRSGGAR